MDIDNAEASSSTPKRNYVYIKDTTFDATPQPALDPASLPDGDTSICIDNGSHSWRAGYSTMSSPYVDRLNVISRYRERKNFRNLMLFGSDVDADATSRSNTRYMFDGDMLVHGDLLECALDFTFLQLGITGSRVDKPIVMTERLANPLFTRAMTSELLFELYGAPSVTYGIDSLFAFSRHRHPDGLAINMGHNASTVIPVVDGRGILSRSKRIPWGGAQASDLMLRLAQLKYPGFPTKVTSTQATFMARETWYFSSNYEEELRELGDPVKLSEMTKVVQFPYTTAEVVEKSEAELAAAAEKRREQGKRLQDMQAKQRAEKLAAKAAELEEYKALIAERSSLKRSDYLLRISETTPFETEAELEAWIKRTESDIRRKQKKEMGEEEVEEEPSFPLVDRPDEELNEEEIKEKRRQRLMKAGWEARVKVREEKKREKERLEEIRQKEENERIHTPDIWAAKLRAEQEAVIARMQERKKKKAQLGDRKSAAAQSRMKSIASLAAEGPPTKKKKGEGEKDDGFGKDDSDWAVYREIGGDDESEAEEEDIAQLDSLEARLLQYDPSFTEDNTLEGRQHLKNALINAFVRGGNSERYNPEDVAQNHQLHLNVERIRVPETWFQPSMVGLDCAGLGEVAGWVLNGFEEDERKRLMQCIVVTGGCANIPNIIPKMRNTLIPVLPFRAPLKIVSSYDGGDPRLEAWKGMAEWSRTEEAKKARVTRQEYDEHGSEWLKEHAWGNPPP
ncbi:putative actin-like protein ARP5 [Naematelia encephala]|uniref:Putative actin-like protein ARP5 n=1 Tax=Naematelia encephala TaxID=71784 RepID=A0A1Y2BHR1_9TREE|nr:putative actin-like protein ARP5 [Naematelia encephala]